MNLNKCLQYGLLEVIVDISSFVLVIMVGVVKDGGGTYVRDKGECGYCMKFWKIGRAEDFG